MTHQLNTFKIIKQLIDALDMAKTGLRWYRDANPELEDGSDDEADSEIESAIEAGNSFQQSVIPIAWRYRNLSEDDWSLSFIDPTGSAEVVEPLYN